MVLDEGDLVPKTDLAEGDEDVEVVEEEEGCDEIVTGDGV